MRPENQNESLGRCLMSSNQARNILGFRNLGFEKQLSEGYDYPTSTRKRRGHEENMFTIGRRPKRI